MTLLGGWFMAGTVRRFCHGAETGRRRVSGSRSTGALTFSSRFARMLRPAIGLEGRGHEHRLHAGLLLLLGMPFILALWIAFREREAGAGGRKHEVRCRRRRASTSTLKPRPSVSPQRSRQPRTTSVHWRVRVTSGSIWRWTRRFGSIRTRACLRTVLRDTLLAAIQATPGGHVLVTAQILGGQPNIEHIR